MSEYKQLRFEFMNDNFREELKDKLGCSCVNCESTVDIEYHHIIPLALGGSNRLTNIVPLCYTCHQIAHGSKNIRQLCRAKNTGRPKLIKPDNADNILWDYMYGKIGRKECQELLRLKPGMKLNDVWYYKNFIQENHILSHINKIDFFACEKNCNKDHTGRIIAQIKFKNKEDYVKYA